MAKNDSPPLTRDIAPFGVRIPADLKERVAAAAKANSRSMNAEIVTTLEEKYPALSADTEKILADVDEAERLVLEINSITEKMRETKDLNKFEQLQLNFDDLAAQFRSIPLMMRRHARRQAKIISICTDIILKIQEKSKSSAPIKARDVLHYVLRMLEDRIYDPRNLRYNQSDHVMLLHTKDALLDIIKFDPETIVTVDDPLGRNSPTARIDHGDLPSEST